MGNANPNEAVRPADVVIDCGAHVGVFTQRALARGASKVVAVEPDPVNLECLRRNLSEEIAAGKVILVPKGVWNSVTTLTFSESTQNSGMNSFVQQERGTKMQLPVTTIDHLVEELQPGRVDYIKMDIEGSEREALKGA
jgi:FkbM family methyltransferase